MSILKKFVVAFLLCQACTLSEDVTDTTRVYTITYSNSSYIDTVTASDSVIMFGLQKHRTTFLSRRKNMLLSTSVERNKFSSKSSAQFFPPIGGILNNTAMLPPPKIDLPVKLGDSLYSEHTTSEKLFGKEVLVQGWNVVTEKVPNPIGLENGLTKDSVWKITSVNTNDKNVEGTYYYSDKQGFVALRYRFDTVKVSISLAKLEYNKEE